MTSRDGGTLRLNFSFHLLLILLILAAQGREDETDVQVGRKAVRSDVTGKNSTSSLSHVSSGAREAFPQFSAPSSPGTAEDGTSQHLHHHEHSFTEQTEEDGIIVETLNGRIQGKILPAKNNIKVAAFLGVPFAEPPIQDLRFRPPVRVKAWKHVRKTREFGPICYQPGEQKIWDTVQVNNRSKMVKKKIENYTMSEDCLTLNLYVPLLKENGSLPWNGTLPVFFFVHGGSYYGNAGRLYPGQILAAVQNLIVVTFNYRLGPLGFLSTGDKSAPGNFGLLDQALALDWVYENIGFFGGDANKITLVGNSAGAASVMFHLFSKTSRGKFVGLIVQSGCSGAPWAIQYSPRKHAETLANKLNCATKSSEELLRCLRKRSPLDIMKNAKLEDGLSLAFAVVIDGNYGGNFLSARPEALIRGNEFAHVPILTGFTRDEVTIWFVEFGPETATKDLVSILQFDVVSLLEGNPAVTSANIAAMIHSVTVQYLYRAGVAENDTHAKTTFVSDFISDVGLKAPCIKEMNLLTKYNTKPVYLYEFNYYSVDDVKMGRRDWIGSYHESELQFIFGEAYMNYSNHLRSYNDKKMSDLMMKLWGNFIHHGNPSPGPKADRETNPPLRFVWRNYSEVHQDYAVLGLKSHLQKYFLSDRMLFWNFFFPIFRDYPFRISEPGAEKCDDSWMFWVLVCSTCILGFILLVFLTVLLHKRFSALRHSVGNNVMEIGTVTVLTTNNNRDTLNNSSRPSSNYRVSQNL